MKLYLKINNLIVVVLFCFAVLVISGCDKMKKAEYDSNDPNFHGQVIHFSKEPVVYMLLSQEKDAGEYEDEAIKIERVLVEKSLISDPYTSFGQRPNEDIREGMSFSIISSYWARYKWFYRLFNTDIRILVLQDENDVISSCSFNMLMFSDREDLLK